MQSVNQIENGEKVISDRSEMPSDQAKDDRNMNISDITLAYSFILNKLRLTRSTLYEYHTTMLLSSSS